MLTSPRSDTIVAGMSPNYGPTMAMRRSQSFPPSSPSRTCAEAPVAGATAADAAARPRPRVAGATAADAAARTATACLLVVRRSLRAGGAAPEASTSATYGGESRARRHPLAGGARTATGPAATLKLARHDGGTVSRAAARPEAGPKAGLVADPAAAVDEGGAARPASVAARVPAAHGRPRHAAVEAWRRRRAPDFAPLSQMRMGDTVRIRDSERF